MTQTYYGTKRITAFPMKKEFSRQTSENPPRGEVYEQDGYAVTYEDGYQSWSPKEVFEAAYQPITAMSFGHAIKAAKDGYKIGRAGWNGKNMFVAYMSALHLPPFNTQGTDRKVNDRTAKWIGEDKPLNSQPYFAMYNAQEEWIVGWVASQSDMLADDWMIVE